MTTIDDLKTAGQENWATFTKLSQEQPVLLPALGVVTLAAVTGGVTGVVLAKGLIATRGAAAIKAALAAKGAAATKAALAVKGATAAQGGAHATGLLNTVVSGGAAAVNGATAAVNGATSLLNGMTTGGAALGDKVMLLVVHTLTHDTVPITVGAVSGVVVGMVSGGYLGVGAMQGQVRQAEADRQAQAAQIAALAAEVARLEAASTTTTEQNTAALDADAPAPTE